MAQVMLIENMTKKQLASAYGSVLSDLHDEKKRSMEKIAGLEKTNEELKSVIEDLRNYNITGSSSRSCFLKAGSSESRNGRASCLRRTASR